MNPNVSYGFGVITISQNRFVTNEPLWCRMLIVGEAVHADGVGVEGIGEHRNSRYFPLNFAINLKVL